MNKNDLKLLLGSARGLPKKSTDRSKPKQKRKPYVRQEDADRKLIIDRLRKDFWKVTRVEPLYRGQFGLGDLWIRHQFDPLAGWAECKSATGKMGDHQEEFQADCQRCGVNYWVLRWDYENKNITWSET
jgi:hypothetical protein